MVLSLHHTPIFLLPRTPFPSLSSSSFSFVPPKVSLPSPNVSCFSSNLKVAELADEVVMDEEGPVELPSSVSSSIFATSDDPTPLQVATSLLLTGAISVFLFRSLRPFVVELRRLKIWSTGATKSLKEEAMESLKTMTPTLSDGDSTKSPIQALLGGLAAGAIALLLYKFTLTVENGLNRQNLSDNFSVRQITVTIRTIINGICYLATFVFGINAVGLVLYSGQLALNSFMEASPSSETSNNKLDESISPRAKGLAENFDKEGSAENSQGSDDRQQ